MSHVRGNRGVETFEEAFGSFVCEVFGQFIKGFGLRCGAA